MFQISMSPIVQVLRKGNEEKTKKWHPFAPGEAVYLRRPKGWKLGAKWIGPFEVVCRVDVDYKIKSDQVRITVVHHDRLKRGYAPLNNGNVVCPARELGATRWFCSNEQRSTYFR